MALKEQLMADFKEAMKAHDEVAKNTISFARAAIKQYEVKMRKDALADFEKAGRTDLAESYQAEIDILKRYLPEQLSAEKLREVVASAAADLNIEGGMQNMGKLMGAVMGKVKGLADGGDVKKEVEAFLKK